MEEDLEWLERLEQDNLALVNQGADADGDTTMQSLDSRTRNSMSPGPIVLNGV